MSSPFEISPVKSVIVLVLGLLTVIVCWTIPPAKEADDTGVVMDLPFQIGPLFGFHEDVSKAELEILPPDTTFARKSYGAIGSDQLDRILCSIVLSGREKRSIHRPERCLPGQGWNVIGSNVVDVPLASGHPLKVMALLLNRPVTLSNGTISHLEAYYLYWYVGRNVTTPYSFQRVMLTNWDLIVHRANQRWAYVIVMAPITEGFLPNGRTADQTLFMLKQFIRASVPSFVKMEMPSFQSAGISPKQVEAGLYATGH
ncbi:MAG: EpsI family protein [Methylacidiphilales bacterium]|nr:EpsI family protein [Candidatus Methylacidiphilales bacterium]